MNKDILILLFLLSFNVNKTFCEDNSKTIDNISFIQGKKLFNQNKFTESMKYFRKAIEKNPKNKKAKFYLEQATEEYLKEKKSYDKEIIDKYVKKAQRKVKARELARGIGEDDSEKVNEVVSLYIEDKTKEDLKEDSFNNYFTQAKVLFENNFNKLAKYRINDALEKDPNNLKAKELKKEINFIFERERERKRKIEKINKDEAENLYRKGLEYYNNEDYVEAIIYLRKAISLDNKHESARGLYFDSKNKIEQQTQKLTQSSLLFKQVEDKYKKAIDYYINKDFKKAYDYLKEIKDVVITDRSLRYLDLVSKRIKKQKIIEQAMIHKKDAIRYLEKGNLEDAKESLTKAIKIYPDFIEAKQLLENVKNKIERKKRIQKLIRNAGNYINKKYYISALYNLEKVLIIKPENKEAKDLIRTASKGLMNSSISKDEKELINMAKSNFNKGNYQRAIELYSNAAYKNPDNREVLKKILLCHKYKKREEKEKQKRILKIKKEQEKEKKIEEYINLAEEKFENKNYTVARKYFEKVLNLDENNKKAKEGIQNAEAKLNNTEELKKGEKEHYKQGLIYYSQGKYSKAIKEWKQVLNINSENEKAKENIKAAKEKIELYNE
ncbi:MAG: tetratricopeptide repeat protein [Atribacterota bacterium]